MYRQIPEGGESTLAGNGNLPLNPASTTLHDNHALPEFVEISLKTLPFTEETSRGCMHGCTLKARRKAKRLSDRRMRNVLFGSDNESRRFSADLNRWSSRSADQVPSAKCHCSTCPVHGMKLEEHRKPNDSFFVQKTMQNVSSVASNLSSTVVSKTEHPSSSSLATNESNGTDLPVETVQLLFFQVFIPFLVAGFGNVAVGLLLAHVQHWQVFKSLHGLMMLTSAFLGFKGNLEMSLAARLSTKANCGQMDQAAQQWKIGYSNVALVQVQSIGVALLVALVSAIGTAAAHQKLELESVKTLVATSLSSASASSLLLASLMVLVVVLARKCRVNPDNVSTLIAACLGDITAVGLIALTSGCFFEHPQVSLPVILTTLCIVLPMAAILAAHSPHTSRVLCSGWMPLILAMLISSLSGFVFARSERRFQHIAVFQPIINGTGSNLIAVQVSRISTYLHQRSEKGQLSVYVIEKNVFNEKKTTKSEWIRHCLFRPYRAFIGDNPNVRTARLLLVMVIPAHLTYLTTIWLIKPQLQFNIFFVTSYMLVSLTQVSFLLFLSHLVVPLLWLCNVDPDTSAIPVIMSCADMMGTCMLGLAFNLLNAFFQNPIAMLKH